MSSMRMKGTQDVVTVIIYAALNSGFNRKMHVLSASLLQAEAKYQEMYENYEIPIANK